MEKDANLSVSLVKGLVKFWPITNPAKEVIFLNEIEEIMDTHILVVQ